jgi:hypothetical protein
MTRSVAALTVALALMALSAQAAEPTEKVQKLIAALKKAATTAQSVQASRALAELGEEARPAVPLLVQVAGRTNPTKLELITKGIDPARIEAVRALMKIDPDKGEAALKSAMRCRHFAVILWAKITLNKVRASRMK